MFIIKTQSGRLVNMDHIEGIQIVGNELLPAAGVQYDDRFKWRYADEALKLIGEDDNEGQN